MTLREILHDFGISYRVESRETRKEDIDKAESQIKALRNEDIITLLADLRTEFEGKIHHGGCGNLDGIKGLKCGVVYHKICQAQLKYGILKHHGDTTKAFSE